VLARLGIDFVDQCVQLVPGRGRIVVRQSDVSRIQLRIQAIGCSGVVDPVRSNNSNDVPSDRF